MAKQDAKTNQPAAAMGLEMTGAVASGKTDLGVVDRVAAAMPPTNGRNEDGRPYCGKHNALMVAGKTTGNVTHYYCQVEGCQEAEKKARPEIRVPAKPIICGRALCAEKLTALEVDAERSRASAMLTMVCPDCQFTQYVPRPGYVPNTKPRPAEQDFAAR
jgi:hypothetical protein